MRSDTRIFLIILAVTLIAGLMLIIPAAARGPGINDIQPGDTIFIYERGLNLKQLRDDPNNPITELRRYRDDDPEKALINEVRISDDRNADILEVSVRGEFGTYFAYSPIDGADRSRYVRIQKPALEIDVVLARPYHHESVTRLERIPDTTRLAVKIISRDVGFYYRVGNEYFAEVDIVVIGPDGQERMIIGNADLRGIVIDGSVTYTDDQRSAFTLRDMQVGTYEIQARWRTPQGFADFAEDSNIVTFSRPTPAPVTPTPTPEPTPTPVTPTPTPEPTPTPKTPTPTPDPTPTPISAVVPVAGLIASAVLLYRRLGE